MSIQFTPALEPRELLERALKWAQEGQRVALLSLVNIEGSAPYPIGTQMLVNEKGEYHGQITGGCAELALAAQATQQISNGNNTVERYGLGSQYFDIQLPCGSGIDVHFDVQLDQQQLQGYVDALGGRKAVVSHIDCAGNRFQKTYLPNERILVCGQGPIKQSLIELASQSGFEVMSFDPTQTNIRSDELAGVCDQYTALVSLFHEHEYEIDILLATLRHDLFYFGALGSRATHAKRVSQLRERGVSDKLIDKIQGPIGLDIGAVSPAQIAISILAQLISSMNQDGRFAN